MADLSNVCEGTNAATVTTANSSGPNQFDTVTIGATATQTFSTAHVHSGATSVQHHLTTTSASTYEIWKASILTPAANSYYRMYVYLPANPTAQIRVAAFFGASTVLNSAFVITGTGFVGVLNSASVTLGTMTAAVPLNQWVRLDFQVTGISGTTGTISAKMFSGVNLESNTPDINGSLSYAGATVNNLVNEVRIGLSAASTQTVALDVWTDAIAWSDTVAPGPYLLTVPISTRILTESSTGAYFPAALLADSSAPRSAIGSIDIDVLGTPVEGDKWYSISPSLPPPPPPPPNTGVQYGLDIGVNTLLFIINPGAGAPTERQGTKGELMVRSRTVYQGGIGPHCKFFDNNQGILNALNDLTATSYGSAPGETSPYICYRPASSDADLRTAFAWLVANFPNQPIYIAHNQEPEHKTDVTVASYIAKTTQEDRIRSENATWIQWIKLWPCLAGYGEVDAITGMNWQTIVQPSLGKVDGMAWDVYNMDFYTTAWSPSFYIGPMFTAAQSMGIPCSLGEWGTVLSTKGGDTETTRGVRTQSVIDYINTRVYDPVTRPWGCMWANYWENFRGIVGTTTECNTGLVQYVEQGSIKPTFTTLMTAMGR